MSEHDRIGRDDGTGNGPRVYGPELRAAVAMNRQLAGLPPQDTETDYDGPSGVPHYPDPTEIDDGEFWAPGPQPGPDYWALRRNDISLCSAQRPDGRPGLSGLGRCTLGFGHSGSHGDLVDRLDKMYLRTRIMRALLLPVGHPEPTGLPSYQTSDADEAEAITATVMRALFPDAAGAES